MVYPFSLSKSKLVLLHAVLHEYTFLLTNVVFADQFQSTVDYLDPLQKVYKRNI